MGEWQHGSMSGSGTFHWHNGDRFTGGWLDGHMHGTGTKTLHNGDVITGTWQTGRQQGKGTKLFACGDKHTGLYKDDRSQHTQAHTVECTRAARSPSLRVISDLVSHARLFRVDQAARSWSVHLGVW